MITELEEIASSLEHTETVSVYTTKEPGVHHSKMPDSPVQ